MTWYPQDFVTKVPMTDMDMRPNPSSGYPGRTYRFYKGPVVYPFGHGLSYTTFTHSLAHPPPTTLSLSLSSSPSSSSSSLSSLDHRANSTVQNKAVKVAHAKCDGLSLDVHVDVSNAGDRDGSHALLVYSAPPTGQWAQQKRLVAFHKVHVAARSTARVVVPIQVCKDLSVVDNFGIHRIPIGDHSLHIGDLTHSLSIQVEAIGLMP